MFPTSLPNRREGSPGPPDSDQRRADQECMSPVGSALTTGSESRGAPRPSPARKGGLCQPPLIAGLELPLRPLSFAFPGEPEPSAARCTAGALERPQQRAEGGREGGTTRRLPASSSERCLKAVQAPSSSERWKPLFPCQDDILPHPPLLGCHPRPCDYSQNQGAMAGVQTEDAGRGTATSLTFPQGPCGLTPTAA